jgi:hypothetical protein
MSMTSRFEATANGCKGCVATVALLIGLIIPVCARGQLGELVQLHWEAPQGCPTASTVLARVRTLAGTARPPSMPLTAAVQIHQRNDGRFQLQLVVEKDGLVGQRELEAASCEDLAGAVAVNLALQLGDSEPATLAAADTTEAHNTGAAAPPSPQMSPSDNTARRQVSPPVIRALLQGPLLSLTFGPAPNIGASLAGGVALESWRIAAGGTLWLGQTAESARPETGAELARFTARVLGCRGIRVGPADVAPCLSLSVEHLRARGHGPYVRGASAQATWLAIGAGLQARFPLTTWLNVLGSFDLKLQAAQPRLSIDGLGEISKLGWAAAELSLGSEWIL